MNLKQVCQDASRRIISDDGHYLLDEYVRLDGTVRRSLADSTALKTDYYIDPSVPIDDHIRLAVVLSDFTSVFIPPTSGIRLAIGDETGDQIDARNVILPASLFAPGGRLADVGMGVPVKVKKLFSLPLQLGGLNELIHDLGSLMEAGRLLVRPTPLVEVEAIDRPDFRPVTLTVEPNSPGEAWIAHDTVPQHAIPLKESRPRSASEDIIAELILPYLKGVPFGTLARVLEDEHEYLTELRLALKELTRAAPAEPARAKEFLDDRIAPAISRVDRRFRALTRMHALRLAGASVATVGVSLAAYQLTGVVAAVGALLGTAGITGLNKEIAEFWKAQIDAKEMPLYLLWRLASERLTTNS